MNRLAKERSLYLKHAARQKINWYPWSEEAFAAALKEDKPVFVSSGAAWCHWCHVMAKESFEDPETARILNSLFISIKLDRDERPDVDRRLQHAVAAAGGGSGWPLSAFLTPGKKTFFGGTYFPPESRQGRPGFKQVLHAVSSFYSERKGDAESHAASIESVLKPETPVPGHLDATVLDEAEQAVLDEFDHENGGFGSFPKFPLTGAVEFLLRRSLSGGIASPAAEAARRTLLSMARGGLHDQLGGGFHRYSVDGSWLIPHFEKMADDNAGLLKNYAEAYALFGDNQLREAALGIIRFTGKELADPAGGFYASQDADVTPDDEGGYFTWSAVEFSQLLEAEQQKLMLRHLVRPGSAMHHDPSKMVLAENESIETIARETGRSQEWVAETIRRAKTVLLEARNRRQAPFIDRTLYTSLNGMMITAWLRAFPVLNDAQLREFALKSLDRILRDRYSGGRLSHAEQVPALLDDYIHLVDGLLAAYESTGGHRYLETAEELMGRCMEQFLDREGGGFFDTGENILAVRLKPVEDLPHPSANAVAILVLLKLSFLTGKDIYRTEAERCLAIHAGSARAIGIHAGAYFCALHAYYDAATLTAEIPPDGEFADSVRAAAARSYSFVRYGSNQGRVIRCKKGACSAPATSAHEVAVFF